MKKLINEVASVVPDALSGYVRSQPGLRLIEGRTIVLRADLEAVTGAGKVALLSGGGSGHEPAHAGFVGKGMLTAAVAGDVFASPSTDEVLDGIRAVAGPGGVLLIVKNYTGDRLNFGLAAQIARGEGIETELVVVDDDCALGSAEETAGRRGIAGTALVHKIAGAAAEAGLPLAEVKARAEAAIAAVGSMGVALSPCTVPAAGRPNFELGPEEIELGLGIHGEAGLDRVALSSSRELTALMVEKIVADRDLAADTPVCLLVNNLGATPPMELAIVTGDALTACARQGLRVERVVAGTLLTAIDMAGVSLSLMRLDEDSRTALDASTAAPAWVPATCPAATSVVPAPAQPTGETSTGEGDPTLLRVTLACCDAIIAAEPELTRMDQIVGDGDIGRSLASGAEAILAAKPRLATLSGAPFWREVGAIVRRSTGGTSGPLYAILATAAGNALDQAEGAAGAQLARAFAAGVEALQALGGAEPGDRTMVDALRPAARAMEGTEDPAEALRRAAQAARDGAEATKDMRPRRGRSSYVGDRVLGHVDPGAEAVALWLDAAARTL
ncbi:Dihydroxyacetone kinase [Pseudooceanicola marinus]|uniref:Dihydroxyacetone kinase n=1 Tax=Pseudooceanicola marinus TaxID=396013 RepID=A0A1X6YEF8_9RHOB|nr:dihydroxyacetone kinase family protein [Pseudooceanicola marinus]PJE32924.1 dihydroxyacetone kinase subunit DhaK [Pseudooceanicola marinus]SLN18837.1 Dihydroxyacetone kinase [Pseudooceanicola marinus]